MISRPYIFHDLPIKNEKELISKEERVMKKKQSIVTLIVMLIITILLGCTVFQGWGSKHTGSMKNIRTGLDLSGGVSITYEATDENPSSEDMSDTIYKLQQRVDQYSTEALVYQQGANRISIEIPGVTNANEILDELGKPGSLAFYDEEGNEVLSGSDVASAEGVANQNSTTGAHEYLVELSMTEEGKEKFAQATSENVGKQISIVYDGETVSSPVVNEAITGGKAQISGMSSIEEAKNLAAYIRIGSLSLELEEIYSNVVGAQLGEEALSTSVVAGIIGVLLVVLFMILIYRVSGLAAGWALIIFAMLDLTALNAFDLTLTLPGIAGVILTIGMAVDANVIIYTRMREELTAGRNTRQAIKAGFSKAFSAIFDGNITTLIAAAVLYFLGTGTIKGFATTLAMGVVLSMFTALVISRLLSYAFCGLGITDIKYYGTIKERKIKDFIGKKVITFGIAIILIISAPVGMMINKNSTGRSLNYSLDFIGGTATTVAFDKDMSLADLDKEVQPVVSEVTGDANIQFQKVTSSNNVIIKTRELSVDEREELNEKLIENFENLKAEDITAENISSTISGEMRNNATRAVVIAVIFMLLYIFIRFRDMRFASSAVIALLHDISIVLAFYVWSRFSVGSTFIAVMLTILGYSINATIVIFDRIREDQVVHRGSTQKVIVNSAITETLTRSMYSSFTTFITVFVLFIMGVPSVKEFSLPIIIGIVAGAYSSVCVTGPLWYIMKTKIGKVRIIDEDSPAPAEEGTEAGKDEASSDVKSAKTGKKAKKDRSQLQSTKPKKGNRRK